MRRYLFLPLILIGLTAILGQVVLIRELTSIFYGNELSLGIIFASWMIWMAVGSWLVGRFSDYIGENTLIFPLTFCLAAFLLPFEITLVRLLRYILDVAAGELISFTTIIYSTFLILAPYCLLAGFQFSLGCKIHSFYFKNAPQAIGKVYVYDAIGDVIGGLVFSYILVYLFRSFEIVFSISLLNLICALFLVIFIIRGTPHLYSTTIVRRRFYPEILVFVIVLLIILNLSLLFTPFKDEIENKTLRYEWRGLSLVETTDSIYGKLAVVRQDDHYSFFNNGLLMFTTGVEIEAEEIVHFPMLEHPEPKRILIIGGALGGVLNQLLKYNIEEIYYLELDPKIIDFSKRYLPPQDKAALEDKRVKIKHIDGRLFVKQTDERFDVLIINLPNPYTSSLNRFYTLEFFKEVQRVLNKNGVVSFSISSNENYLGPYMKRYNSCIYQSLKKVFKDIILIPGEKLTFIACQESNFLTSNPEVLSKRLKERGIRTKFINRYYLSDRLYPERMQFILSQLKSAEVLLNRDFKPISYYFDVVLWGSYFSPYFKRFFENLSSIKWHHFVLCLLFVAFILALIRKKSYKWSVPLCIMTTGLAAISFELILIFAYQVLYGYVYNYIGILIAGFMAGLVIGSNFMNKHIDLIKDKVFTLTKIEFWIIIYAVILPIVFFLLLDIENQLIISLGRHLLFPLLIILAGSLVGSEFPLASRIHLGVRQTVAHTGGLFYALDLLGACFGSIVVSIFIIPIYGIIKTCLFIALVNLISFILILSSRDKL